MYISECRLNKRVNQLDRKLVNPNSVQVTGLRLVTFHKEK